ncbi:MAG TPA: PQQ-binding-like beta-propeller repeat protein [Thermomicrobiales bacterium]|nr:PQQ-binding-like beta-propeller repeat protein [Thermomicrobiales bacterium]
MDPNTSEHPEQRGPVNPLGGRIHHPVSDQDRRRWAGFVAYVRTCPACSWANDEHALFCTACAADLRQVQATPSSDPRPGVALLEKRLGRDRRVASRKRLGDTAGGSGWVATGIALIVGIVIVNPERTLAVPIWIAAVILAVVGIWQLRIDASALRSWGAVFAACAVLLLGLVGYQAIQASELISGSGDSAGLVATPTSESHTVLLSTPDTSQALTGLVPMYQGNAAHDGIMPGPAPDGTPFLAWQSDTGGELYASPSLENGLLFVSSKAGSLLAYDAATGAPVWSSDVSNYVMRGTPAIADGVIYAGGGFDFRAVNAATGEIIWQVPIQYGGQASPTIAGGLVLVTSQQGWLYALDRATGETVWRIPTEGLAFGAAAVSGDTVVFGTDEGVVYNARLETGRLNWRSQVTGAVFATPVISGGRIFATTGSGELHALDLETGSPLWKANHGSLEPPAVSGDLVVVAASDGGVYGLDAATGTQRWLHPAGRESLTAPVFVGGLVVIGAGSTLLALDGSTGETVWYFLAGDTIESSPVVVGGHVFFGTRDGFLNAVAGR